MDSDLTPVGIYNFRNQHKTFGIKIDDRRRHVYVVGKTGVGKSTLLENMVIADIRAGKGVGVVDPHGELAEKILDFVPEERLDDVIYFDPSDMDYPIAFNPMEQVGNEFRHLVASGIMGVFKKIWPDAWSARMEYILNNTLLALLEFPDATLLGILRMFAEPEYRKKIVENLKDPVIKAFWQNEFSRYSQKLETEALAAIQNKVGQFVSNPLIRNILGQPRSALNMRQIMDTGKIFIVNLSKGKIGEDNSALLGAMIITRLNLAAMSRVDIAERDRRDFFLYVDEFQNFATDSFASILSEARKYHLSLTLAHQYIGQLMTSDSTKVRDAIFGNVGTIITFRVGAEDGEFLEKEFMPEFLQTDLVNLAKANIYVKLMIDGVASRPFSAETIPPQPTPLNSYRDVIIKNSRQKYGTPRAVVESRIAGEWLAKSDVAIGEKIERQGERHLSEVLRPGVRFGVAHDPSSGNRSSSASSPRPPRRMEDVQRQDPQDGRSARDSRAVRSGARFGDGAENHREQFESVPRASNQGGEASSWSAPRPMREEPSKWVGEPADHPPARSVPAEGKKFVAHGGDEHFRREQAESTVVPSRGLSLSALRDGGAGAKREDDRRAAFANEHHDAGDGAEADPARKSTKPNIDIEGLRRAINESLRKQNEGHSASADLAGRTDVRATSGQNQPPQVTRLNVPAHEDADAKQQIKRELAKMGIRAERTRTGDDNDGHDDGHSENHGARSAEGARGQVNRPSGRQDAGFVGPAARVSHSVAPKKSGKDPDIVTTG
jgi:hypothetical protein